MPCLYFEPTKPVDHPSHERARLPLIEEYDGRCHALPQPFPAPGDLRWQCCNQGYSLGRCSHFPSGGVGGALRYSVTVHTPESLELIWIEERDYAPFRHGALHFNLGEGSFLETGLDALLTTQALAFCRSYLKRHLTHPASSQENQTLHSIT